MPIEQLQGVWRIEESRGWTTKRHHLGLPIFSHWLILGDHGIPFKNRLPDPLYFEFRIELDEAAIPHSIRLLGWEGVSGYFEHSDDLLILTMGGAGVKPPRFKYGCGNYFAFTKDHGFKLPSAPIWCRDEITNPHFGILSYREEHNDWIGSAAFPNGTQCEIWATDRLMPIAMFVDKIESLFCWLQENMASAKMICAESVAEWTDEMSGYEHLTHDEIAKTISIDTIRADDGRLQCWASTILIDHSICLWMRFDGNHVLPDGVSIEG